MHDAVPKYLPLPVNVTIVQEMISVKRFGLLTRQRSKKNLEKNPWKFFTTEIRSLFAPGIKRCTVFFIVSQERENLRTENPLLWWTVPRGHEKKINSQENEEAVAKEAERDSGWSSMKQHFLITWIVVNKHRPLHMDSFLKLYRWGAWVTMQCYQLGPKFGTWCPIETKVPKWFHKGPNFSPRSQIFEEKWKFLFPQRIIHFLPKTASHPLFSY